MSMVTIIVVTCEQCGKVGTKAAPGTEVSVSLDDGWLVLLRRQVAFEHRLPSDGTHYVLCNNGTCVDAWWKARRANKGDTLTVQIENGGGWVTFPLREDLL